MTILALQSMNIFTCINSLIITSTPWSKPYALWQYWYENNSFSSLHTSMQGSKSNASWIVLRYWVNKNELNENETRPDRWARMPSKHDFREVRKTSEWWKCNLDENIFKMWMTAWSLTKFQFCLNWNCTQINIKQLVKVNLILVKPMNCCWKSKKTLGQIWNFQIFKLKILMMIKNSLIFSQIPIIQRIISSPNLGI